MAKKVMEDMEEAYSAQDKMLDAICTLLKRVDELEKRCEELEKRESIHNAIDGALNVQKQLDEHEKKINKIGESLLPFDLKLKEHDGRFRNVDTCLDAFVQRLDAADRKFAVINVRLCNANEKSDKLKARLNMVFGAGGGVHLATYGMSVENLDDKVAEKTVIDSAKVIHDFCHSRKSCGSCKFYVNGACVFIHAPCVWHMDE